MRETPGVTSPTWNTAKSGIHSEQYQEIDRYCKEVGIQWFASVWDEPSVDFLEAYNLCATKFLLLFDGSQAVETLAQHRPNFDFIHGYVNHGANSPFGGFTGQG
jgi:hypothetical protein